MFKPISTLPMGAFPTELGVDPMFNISQFERTGLTTCYMTDGTDGTVGGGPVPQVQLPDLPYTSLHLGTTETADTIRAAYAKDPAYTRTPVPVQTTNVYGLTAAGTRSPNVSGRIFVVGDKNHGAEIARAPARATIVPHWHAGVKNGGGAIGGVAQGWLNRGNKLSQGGQKPDGDAVKAAIHHYETVRDARFDQAFAPGEMIVVKADMSDPSVAPEIFINIASVPAPNLKKNSQASRYDRMTFVTGLYRKLLAQLKDTVTQNGLHPSADHPVRVSMPILCTGDDGAITREEAGVIMYRVLGEFMMQNPGYEFIIPVYVGGQSNNDAAEDIGLFMKIMAGDHEAMEHLKDLKIQSPRSVFESMINACRVPDADSGVAFDENFFKVKFVEWQSYISETLGNVPAEDVGSAKMLSESFSNNANAIFATILHKYATIKDSRVVGDSFHVDEVNAERLAGILSDPYLQDDIFGLVSRTLETFPDAARSHFSGSDKMIEIIGIAAATVLNERVRDKVEEVHNDFQQLINQLIADRDRLKQTLDEGRKNLRDQQRAVKEEERKRADFERQIHVQRTQVEELEAQIRDMDQIARDEIAQVKRDGQIDRDDLDKKKQELAAKRTELAQRESDLRTSQLEKDRLQRQVSDLQDELRTVRNNLSSASSRVSAASSSSSTFSTSHRSH